MPRCGNRHQPVIHVVLADQLPVHFPDALAVQQHFPVRSVGVEFFSLPLPLLANQLLLAPATHCQGLFQVGIAFRPNDLALPRHNTHQMVELLLNRPQVVKDIRVVEFKVVQHQRARAVVHKLGTLVEEGAVILIRLNHKERAFAQARGDVKIARHTADHESGLIAAGFQNPCGHSRRGGFAMRTRNGNHPTVAQHKIMQPLRTRHIRDVLFQYRLNARVTTRHGVTDDHQVRTGLKLLYVVTLN